MDAHRVWTENWILLNTRSQEPNLRGADSEATRCLLFWIPFQLVLIAVAGWMNQRRLQMIEYLREENRVLREQLAERHLRLTDDQRRRFAARAKGLGRRILAGLATIVTPETLLRWHRRLIAEWRNRTGIGDTAAFSVHYSIWDTNSLAAQSLTLERHGMEPAPERIRKTPWNEFLRGNPEPRHYMYSQHGENSATSPIVFWRFRLLLSELYP